MKEGPPRRAFFLSSSASVLRQQTVLVSPGEPTGNAHLTAPHADGLKLGELSLPLGTARASVAAGHLALGNCHVHRSSLLMAASRGTWSCRERAMCPTRTNEYVTPRGAADAICPKASPTSTGRICSHPRLPTAQRLPRELIQPGPAARTETGAAAVGRIRAVFKADSPSGRTMEP